MYSHYRLLKKRTAAIGSLLWLVLSLNAGAQDRFTTIELSDPQNNKFTLRTQDLADIQIGSTDKPYVVYGTDFRGSGGFFISFNLETRQTIHYQLVDMTGRQIAAQDLREVLDQTYRVQANSVSNGAYIMRLKVNGKCYSEKVFFTP